jgi:20S proteasome alpha/beta subunit
VTIAIGLCGNEGLVLAADSQETTAYIKAEVGKSETIIFANHNVFCFVGAGHADYIKTATQKATVGLDKAKNPRDIRRILEDNLLDFFDKHLARWAYFPDHDRPTVELLIGYSMHAGAFGLFHYDGTAFHSVSQKAIGLGVLIADGLIGQYYTAGVTLAESCSIAVYIISKVKSQVEACGGFTDLTALRKNGDFAFPEFEPLKTLEKEMEDAERESIKAFKKLICSKVVKLGWMTEHLQKKAKSLQTT